MSKEQADRIDFHEFRRAGVTGSDAPKLLSAEGAFGDSLDVYLEKVFPSTPIESTALMRRGQLLEPIFATEYERITGNSVRRQPRRIHPEHDWRRCHIDRQVLANKNHSTRILEIKTVSRSKFASIMMRGLLEATHVQALHNVDIWGYCSADVFVGCADLWEFATWTIQRDEKAAHELEDIEKYFWFQNVIKQKPPIRKAEKIELPSVPGKALLMDDCTAYLLAARQLLTAEEILADAKGYVDSIHDKIQSIMKDLDAEVADGAFVADGMLRTMRYYFRENQPGRKTFQQKIALGFLTSLHLGLKDAIEKGDMDEIKKVAENFVNGFDAEALYKRGKPTSYKRRYFLKPNLSEIQGRKVLIEGEQS